MVGGASLVPMVGLGFDREMSVILMMRIDSEGRRYLTSWDACESAARDFAGAASGDFNIPALASALFDRVYTSDGVRFYERPDDFEATISACDYTLWREAVGPLGGLIAERWHRCGGGIYHVALFNSERGASLVVTDVPEMGASLWDPGAGRGYDSGCPAHWGALDAILGNRRLWRGELADAAARFIGD